MAWPIRAAVLAALLIGAAPAGTLGIGLKVNGFLLVLAIGVCGILAAALTAVFLRRWRLREATRVWRRERDGLTKRWANEVEPILREAQVSDLPALESACRTAQAECQKGARLRTGAGELEKEADQASLNTTDDLISLQREHDHLTEELAGVPEEEIQARADALPQNRDAISREIMKGQRNVDDLAKARNDLLEARNQISVKRGVAQVRVESTRSERDQAVALVGKLDVAYKESELRLQEARTELERIRGELAALEVRQLQPSAVLCEQVQRVERELETLKKRVFERRHNLDQARHELAKVQAHREMANSSATGVDLADLEQRVTAARKEIGEEADLLVPDAEETQTRVQLARQIASERELAVKVLTERLSDARLRFEHLTATLGQPADQVLIEAEQARQDAENALKELEETLSTEVEEAEKEFQEAQVAIARLEPELTAARTRAEVATRTRDEARTRRDEARGKFDILLRTAPTPDVTAAEEALTQARGALAEDLAGSVGLPENLVETKARLTECQAKLQKTQQGLDEARGALQQVGGTVAREKRDQEVEALEALRKSAEDLEFEYKATKHLFNVLKEAEAKHTAHLGRSLAKPVTDLFLDFTAGRYAQVVLDPDLRVRKIAARGSERELGSLSVGTRDQLATLVRLALAAHLKSVVVLDDQLTQSDPNRLGWFRDRLRASVRDHNHQVIVITCRPLDYLLPGEMPASPCNRWATNDGSLTVMDLEQVASCG
jgi:DNA repair exonuclease SbcCD ATPase subunit